MSVHEDFAILAAQVLSATQNPEPYQSNPPPAKYGGMATMVHPWQLVTSTLVRLRPPKQEGAGRVRSVKDVMLALYGWGYQAEDIPEDVRRTLLRLAEAEAGS